MADSIAELEARVALLAGELAEARAAQAATADVLRMISASAFDLDSVLTAVIRTAISICDATRGVIWLSRGGQLFLAAHVNYPPEWVAAVQDNPITPAADAQTTSGLAAFSGEVVHVEDVPNDPRFRSLAAHKLGDYKAGIAVPMKRDGKVEGVISLSRPQARLFTESQVALVQTFAEQAVIAIGNARLFDEVQARNRELAQSLEQQTATSEILHVISRSPTDIQPVLNAVAASAAQLCDAFDALLFLKQGEMLSLAAHHGPIPIDIAAFPATRDWVTGRAVADRVPVHVLDLQAAGDEFPEGRSMALRLGHRTTLATPLLREDGAIGGLVIRRTEVRPFSDKQIELLKTFADQAVIAIENVRLFDEVQARNREVTEALEQQTATAEVLKTISSSAFDLDAVLHTLVKSASDLCHASMGCIYLRDGDVFRPAMQVGWTQEFYEYMSQHPMPPGRGSVTSRAALTGSIVHIPDALDDPEYTFGGPQVGHFRTLLGVPLIRDGNVTGVFVLARPTVKPFSQREIELVQTFSDQALIALENVRLFDEVQARNREVTEALEQQTATGDILRVIAASPTDIQPVLQVVAESAARFCDTYDAGIFLAVDGMLVPKGHYGPIAFDFGPMPIARDWVVGRAYADCETVHVHDIAAAGAEFPVSKSLAERLGQRTMLATPLMRDSKAIGALVIRRIEVKPFSEKQIKLLKTFADQAVIAIENVRLFDEVQARNREVTEALERQTATGAILRVIAASPTDIQPVLKVVAESAARFCDTHDAVILLPQGGMLAIKAHHGPIPLEMAPLPITRDWVTGRAFIDRKTLHVHDLIAAAEEFPVGQALAKRQGHRTIAATPLMRSGEAVGALVIRRTELRPFSDKQIELVQIFADQAAIAIENVRLFEEVHARNRALTESLEQQTATNDILSVISSSPTDLQPVFDMIAERSARLCEAEFCAVFRFDGELIHFVAGHGLSPVGHEAMTHAYPMPPGRAGTTARAVMTGKVEQIPDVDQDPHYTISNVARAVNARSITSVPMLKNNRVVGAINVARSRPGLFPARQIALLQTFADQAVIAIENVRLFDEVQARTAELGESLQQQTATADVLKVISRSAFDLPTVFDTLVQSAAKLCGANYGGIYMREGDHLRAAAAVGAGSADVDSMMSRSIAFSRSTVSGRVVLSGEVEHIADVQADPEYDAQALLHFFFSDTRALMGVPLLRGGKVDGVFVLGRPEPGAFSPRQAELVQTFADQAVIAIENVRLFDEVQARTAELGEALQQQTATADVLKVISRSAFDLPTVLQTLVDSAIRLCGADMGAITLREGDSLHYMAGSSQAPELLAYERSHPHPLGRGTFQGRAAVERMTIHVPDVLLDAEYERPEAAKIGNFRAVLSVPLKRGQETVGVFGMARRTAGPFAQRQIELVETFADQAAIAIENVRLFDEVQARTTELGEALQQQTATADVLKVISRSAFDLQTVLDTLTESAVRLCRADKGSLERLIDGGFQYVAMFGFPPSFSAYGSANPTQLGRGSAVGRAVEERHIIQIDDILNDPEYTHGAVAEAGGIRTVLAVPLLRQDELIGVFAMIRAEPNPFTAREIELVKTFADQAVIAIENVRLFDEVQARTAELAEALQQQTATADVLKAISRSTFDLQPVLDTLAATAVRVCEADMGSILRRNDDVLEFVANAGFPQQMVDYVKSNPLTIAQKGGAASRAVVERRTVHLPDVLTDPSYAMRDYQTLGAFRTIMAVPLLLGEGAPIGVFTLARADVRPFTAKQIELVETFADQAVIAIENVRLFDEVQARTAELSESLQQQTATADVLKAISRSTFDLQPVLDTLSESAAKLCDADTSVIFKRDGDLYRWSASYGNLPEAAAFAKAHPYAPGRDSVTGRVALEARAVHVSDVLADPEYRSMELQKLGGYRTILCVPILREGTPVGVFALTRSEVRDFTPRQIELLETFADQSGIAIENVRLFEELQARTRDLSNSLEDLRTAQDRLVQTEKLASLGQLTAGIAHEIKNPLNFVNNFAAVSGELIDDLRNVLADAPLEPSVREEVAELTVMLKGNFEKVVQHGKRADSIVRNMLLHSRAGSGEHRPVDINAVVEESLNLAYHGARAEKQGFNVTLRRDFDPQAGDVDLYPQEMTRVLLNLISNGFYATARRKALANGGAYEPVVAASTRNLGDQVEIRIRDNGTGIPPEVKEKMFNPFFTTKPAGEGTGLGLSLSHDIVVKQHAGTIDVDTEPGEFTEFRIVLPRAAASLGKPGGAA